MMCAVFARCPSESHVTGDGQSVNSTWCLAPSAGHKKTLYYVKFQYCSQAVSEKRAVFPRPDPVGHSGRCKVHLKSSLKKLTTVNITNHTSGTFSMC
jgi:hypothetical protein